MRVLLDTNAYSALRLGDSVVAEQLRRSEEVLMSVIVAGDAQESGIGQSRGFPHPGRSLRGTRVAG